MKLHASIYQRRLALLFTAVLLLCNALVTAHAFGDIEHAVKDGCQICHQLDRQPVVPVADIALPDHPFRHVPPAEYTATFSATTLDLHFQPRAPPCQLIS